MQRCSARPIWGGWACWAPQKNIEAGTAVSTDNAINTIRPKSRVRLRHQSSITNLSHSSRASASARILSSCGCCGCAVYSWRSWLLCFGAVECSRETRAGPPKLQRSVRPQVAITSKIETQNILDTVPVTSSSNLPALLFQPSIFCSTSDVALPFVPAS
jgi:hypothetical protein